MLSSFKKDICLKQLSTFHIGGKASYLCEITNQKQALDILRYLEKQKTPYMVLGKGSNCLFDDNGFKGVILLNNMKYCHLTSEGLLTVESGYSFPKICLQTLRSGFSGLEFGTGIPGSLGGAIYMNAGAHNSDISQHLITVTYIKNLEIIKKKKENLSFDYRISYFHKESAFITEAQFQLRPKIYDKKEEIELREQRTSTQPLQYKSAGCIFKNPAPNISAGFLIDSCGLKGLSKGDAEISQQHANFIVNKGKASSKDVLYLIETIKNAVFNKTEILLKEEIKIIPEIKK